MEWKGIKIALILMESVHTCLVEGYKKGLFFCFVMWNLFLAFVLILYVFFFFRGEQLVGVLWIFCLVKIDRPWLFLAALQFIR